MKEKNIILVARVLSAVFTPFYLSFVGMTVLFTFSYLSQMPWGYKLSVLAMVYFFTILMPTLLIKLYRNYHGWTLIQLSRKERRVVPYLLSIVSYYACFYVMRLYNIPHFMGNILMAALVIQIVCSLINVWWKVSTHTAAIGGRGWRTARLLVHLHVQPHLVAMSHPRARRTRRHQPHHTAPAHSLAGDCRLRRRRGYRLCCDIGAVAPPNPS